MNKLSRFAVTALFALTCAITAQTSTSKPGTTNDDELIQIAILLDASNSMDGLIEQAKSQLWKIVNEFALAKRDGKTPRLEVGFFEYGKSSLSPATGYIRQIVPLSTDLDKISDELFKLTTNGGDEYCGQVIDVATKELSWNPSNKVMKAIFIAGNEPFTQGNVDYRKSCKTAIAKGIAINTIFCGNTDEGISSNWKDGADLADGSYMSINQNQVIVDIKAPQDSLIAVLGAKLNETYIGYGSAGVQRKSMQAEQDMNAMSKSREVMVQRSVAKVSKSYSNAEWDLVDAKKEKKLDLAKVKAEELPAEMQSMAPAERESFVTEKAKEREELQTQISKLNEERRKYVAAQQKTSGDNTLDKAIISTVRKQASSKGYIFK
jgi:von Willebrand factor type A domain